MFSCGMENFSIFDIVSPSKLNVLYQVLQVKLFFL